MNINLEFKKETDAMIERSIIIKKLRMELAEKDVTINRLQDKLKNAMIKKWEILFENAMIEKNNYIFQHMSREAGNSLML